MFNVLDENERLLVARLPCKPSFGKHLGITLVISLWSEEEKLQIYFLFLSRSGAFSQTVFSKGCDENENDFGLHEKV